MRAGFRLVLPALLTLGLFSCGGGGGEPPDPNLPPSGITNRVLAANDHPDIVNVGRGSVGMEIIDAETDRPTFRRISLTSFRPSFLELSPGREFTVVFHEGVNSLALIDNPSEQAVAGIGLPDWTESIVIPNREAVYAAVRGIGAVVYWNLQDGSTTNIAVPTVRRLVRSPDGKRVLAFSDDSNSLTVIDTDTRDTTAVGGFDRPVWGVFTSDSNKAYILNCGPQCGGGVASVTELNMADLTLGANAVVSAATTGLLDGSNLYVAGATPGGGVLDVVNVSTMTVSTAGVAISDGFHHKMALGANSKLFIAARACNNVANGCLSIYNTSAQTAVIGGPKGEVTGLQPISGRNVVYVAEGGELRIYDTATGAEQASQINFTGRIVDVKQID